MSCFQVFCVISVVHLSPICLPSSWLVSHSVSVCLPWHHWLWRVDSAKASLRSIHPTLNQLYSGNAQHSPASPLPSSNQASSFRLEIMSIICLVSSGLSASRTLEIYQHMKEKYFLSIIIYYSHSIPKRARRYLASPPACLLTCVDFAVWKEHFVE